MAHISRNARRGKKRECGLSSRWTGLGWQFWPHLCLIGAASALGIFQRPVIQNQL